MFTSGTSGRAPALRSLARDSRFARTRIMLMSVLLFAGFVVQAQVPAPLHADLGLVVNGRVDVIARQANGGVLLGGSFTSINGVPRTNIARLLPDGSLDPVWNPGADNLVTALAEDGTGAVYAGGAFANIGGQARNSFAKLLGTGSGQVDPDWNDNGGLSGVTTSIAVAADDSIFLAGTFSYFAGVIRNGLGKMASDGTPDPDWNPAPNLGSGATHVALDDNGNVFVGGYFNFPRSGVAKLSPTGTGAVDPDWAPGGPGSWVKAIAFDGGSVYVAGAFTSMGGQARLNIAKVSGTGTGQADVDWNPSADAAVATLALGNDGAVYAGGEFSSIGGAARKQLARLAGTGNGAADAAWNFTPESLWDEVPGSTPFTRIYTLAVDLDGTVYAGGEFTSIGGLPRLGFAALDASRTALDVERSGVARALARTPEGGMIVGGTFLKSGDSYRINVLRVQPDGALDPDWDPIIVGEVDALAVDAAGDVYLGGDFAVAGGAARAGLAKLAASGGTAVADWNPAPDGQVSALALDASGGLFVGGNFANIGGAMRSRIAKLATATGSADGVWNPGANGHVRTLAVAGSELYAGGDFNNLDNQFRRHLGRMPTTGSGTPDSWHPNANERVFTVAVAADAVYAGGIFSNIGGQSRSYLAKLERSGTGLADPLWNAGSSSIVRGLAVDGDVVYAVGDFQTFGGLPRTTLARVRADGVTDPNWNPSPNWSLGYCVALDGNDAVYFGGTFVSVGGVTRQGVAAAPLGKNAQSTLVATATPMTISTGTTAQLGSSGGSGTGAVSYALTAGASVCAIDGTTLTGITVGACTVTATKAGDGAYLAASASVEVGVLAANQAPTLVLGNDRFHVEGSIGAQVEPGFASSDPGNGEGAQSVVFLVSVGFDAQDVTDSVTIDAGGTLHYTLTGNTGGARFQVVAQDDGGTANGGIDTSPPREFRVLVGNGANIVLEVTSDQAQRRARTLRAKGPGELIGFSVEVRNNGPKDVAGLGIRIPAPRGLLDVLWSCVAPAGSCSPANGAGSLFTLIDLAAGQAATIALSGTRDPAENYVELRAAIEMPAGVALLSTGEDVLRFVESTSATGVFRHGFE